MSLFISENPLGYRSSSDCIDFPNSTICFHNEKPLLPNWSNLFPNQEVHTTATFLQQQCQRVAQWHLPRLISSKEMIYPNDPLEDGKTVSIFILDTWVDVDHPEFSNRAQRLQSFAEHSPFAFPEHGTHCMGLVGSNSYGSARASKLYSVQVLNDEGTGSFESILRGLEYVSKLDKIPRKIVSVSITGGYSAVVNRAFEQLFNANVLLPIVAAGNSNSHVSSYSPASAKVPVVSATDYTQKRSSFSNFGQSIAMFAPGSNIVSTCPRSSICTMSGTSMATPIVAGAAAVVWGRGGPGLMPRSLWWDRVDELSIKNSVIDVRDTKNKFIFLDQPLWVCNKHLLFQGVPSS